MGLVDRQQPVNRFELYEDAFFHHQIRTKRALDPEISIENRYGYLPLEADCSLLQFVSKALAVGALEESRPELTVYLEGSPEYAVREFSS